MRLGPKIISAVSLLLAAAGCWLAASVAADMIETRSGTAVRVALIEAGHDWADVHTDGLQVHVGGISPTEATRFNALHVAGTIVDDARIVDGTSVTPSEPLAPPRFSMEILRNDEGVALIGLVPETLDRVSMVAEIMALAQGAEVTDLLEVTSHPAPKGWDSAVEVGLSALARLPRAKVSISAGEVRVDAIADSEEQKAELEAAIARRVPNTVRLVQNIAAPRPVVTPFTLRFVIDEAGPHFDACWVDTTRNQGRLVETARELGAPEDTRCDLGLGVPTPDWTNAAILGLRALAELGEGSITFTDADVALIAAESTAQKTFDRIVGDLESNLPEVFSLHSILRAPVSTPEDGTEPAAPDFTASRSPEGRVQLRGRLNSATVRDTVNSYAKARFGAGAIYTGVRIDEALPQGWPVRVLAGLEALSALDHGVVRVEAQSVTVEGRTGNKDAKAEIARLLAEKLGAAQNLSLDVTYDEALDPLAALPTPEECMTKLQLVQDVDKISFEPGSPEIAEAASGLIDQIAEILTACKGVEMQIEIGGHTDSQGREVMNLELSQARADAVLDALTARRVRMIGLTARGYGETTPIADNDTEAGREENRRIEFRLLGEDEATAEDAPADETEDTDADDAATAPPDPTPDTTETAQ